MQTESLFAEHSNYNSVLVKEVTRSTRGTEVPRRSRGGGGRSWAPPRGYTPHTPAW